MCDPLTLAVGGGALLSAATSAYSGHQQASAQNRAARQAQANADTVAAQADQANNRANAKQPNTVALQSANQQAAQGGQSGTMLTGPSGIDPSTLSLGRNTLLGQ